MNRAWIGARANKHHNNSQRSQLFKKFKINFQKLGDATIHIFTLAMFGVLYRYSRGAGMRRKILARKVSPRIFINIWERATKPRECKQNLRTHSEKALQETKNEARSYWYDSQPSRRTKVAPWNLLLEGSEAAWGFFSILSLHANQVWQRFDQAYISKEHGKFQTAETSRG